MREPTGWRAPLQAAFGGQLGASQHNRCGAELFSLACTMLYGNHPPGPESMTLKERLSGMRWQTDR